MINDQLVPRITSYNVCYTKLLRTESQIRGEKQLPLGAFGHQLKPFFPSGDHLIQGDLGRMAIPIGAVELLPVQAHAAIVDEDAIGCRRLFPLSGNQHLILQPAGQSYNFV